MQRREQQRRAATAGGMGGSGYLGVGGGISGYSPVPQRYDAPETSPITRHTPSPAAARPPAFKGSGMKLGTKKTKQAELLDALGGEVLASSAAAGELAVSVPPSPSAASSGAAGSAVRGGVVDGRGSVPVVNIEGYLFFSFSFSLWY